jgi:hypothetical protein
MKPHHTRGCSISKAALGCIPPSPLSLNSVWHEEQRNLQVRLTASQPSTKNDDLKPFVAQRHHKPVSTHWRSRPSVCLANGQSLLADMVYIDQARPTKRCPPLSRHFSLCHATLYIPFTQTVPQLGPHQSALASTGGFRHRSARARTAVQRPAPNPQPATRGNPQRKSGQRRLDQVQRSNAGLERWCALVLIRRP